MVRQAQKHFMESTGSKPSGSKKQEDPTLLLQFIHFLYLSTSYLIFGTYHILSLGSATPQSLHIVTTVTLGRCVLCLSLSNTAHLLLGPLL